MAVGVARRKVSGMSKSQLEGQVVALTDDRWKAFVAAAPNANAFHHPAWSDVLVESYGYRPFVVTMCDAAGEIQAGLPVLEVASPLTGRRWIALPFTDHCRLLSRDQASSDPDQADLGQGGLTEAALIRYLEALRREAGIPSLELRTEIPARDGIYLDDSQVLHLLRLSPDPQEVFDGFHHSQVQRNIARAEREGIEIRRGEGRKALDTFYALHLDTRHRLGVPVQPRHYFDLLGQKLLDTGLGFILLAYAGAHPVAGAVFLTYQNTLTYKYGASNSEYWSLRPNHALFWTAIRWGCEHGYEIFDWGKTAADNEGLQRFKGQWGAEALPLVYSMLDTRRSDVAPRAALSKRWSGLMETVIRKSPKFVCRTLGELLYGHFA